METYKQHIIRELNELDQKEMELNERRDKLMPQGRHVDSSQDLESFKWTPEEQAKLDSIEKELESIQAEKRKKEQILDNIHGRK